MKLDKIAFRTKHIHLKKDGSIPLSKDAPYDFEDGDTNRFKELKAFPKVPYTNDQITRAMKSLHKMIEKQASNYGKGKLFKAGIVVSEGETTDDEETPDENPVIEQNDSELVQQCYDLLKHLSDHKDEQGMQMFMSIVSDIIDFSDDDFTADVESGNDSDNDVDDEDAEKVSPKEVAAKKISESEDVLEIPDADAYGGVLMKNNTVLLREPSNHFGGYVWTFAKGRVDPGEDAKTVALREVFEETGYHAKITHVIPKVYGGSTSSTVMFIMEPVGEPHEFGWETQSIKWATYEEAVDLINQTKISVGRKRDLEILNDAFHGRHTPIETLDESILNEAKLTDEQRIKYKKWRELVNMSPSALRKFKETQMSAGKKNASKYPGLKPAEARAHGISSGVQSANWILKMKETPVAQWTPEMWRWAGKQISFISRMKGNAGPLYDSKGNPTRKLLSLKIWGHNPSR